MSAIVGISRRPEPCFYIEHQWEQRNGEPAWTEYEEMDGGSSHHFTTESAEERVASLAKDRLDDDPDDPLILRVVQYADVCATVTCPTCEITFDTEGEGYTVHWQDGDEDIVKQMSDMEWRLHDGRLLCNGEECRCSIEGHVWESRLTGPDSSCRTCYAVRAPRP